MPEKFLENFVMTGRIDPYVYYCSLHDCQTNKNNENKIRMIDNTICYKSHAKREISLLLPRAIFSRRQHFALYRDRE